jgi:hypothetical protein
MRAATVVYFILSHTNVPHVLDLIRRIRSEVPESLVLVHHDASETPFDGDAIRGDARVHLLDRWVHGEWAQFSLVDIVLLGLEDLERRGVDFGWLVLLSGQDYPVRPLTEFETALAQSGDGFLEYDPDPGSLLDRYRFRWFRLPRALENGVTHRVIGALTRLNGRQPLVRFLSGRVGCRVAFAMRRPPLPAGTRTYKGTQWWALSARALAHVREYARTHPDFMRHYRDHTIMPDESFFQTILLNAHGYTFVNEDGRFTKWSSPSAASPDVLRSGDYEEIVSSGCFFARKFDPRTDDQIIARFRTAGS